MTVLSNKILNTGPVGSSSLKPPAITLTELQGDAVQTTGYSSSTVITVGAQAGQALQQLSSFRKIIAAAITADQRAREWQAKSLIMVGQTPLSKR